MSSFDFLEEVRTVVNHSFRPCFIGDKEGSEILCIPRSRTIEVFLRWRCCLSRCCSRVVRGRTPGQTPSIDRDHLFNSFLLYDLCCQQVRIDAGGRNCSTVISLTMKSEIYVQPLPLVFTDESWGCICSRGEVLTLLTFGYLSRKSRKIAIYRGNVPIESTLYLWFWTEVGNNFGSQNWNKFPSSAGCWLFCFVISFESLPLLHTKAIAALSIFATLWLNVNCFRPSKLSCCKQSQRISVKLNNIADDGSLETPEDLIVTLPKIMVGWIFIFTSSVIFFPRNNHSLLFNLCHRSADMNPWYQQSERLLAND